MNGQYLGAGNPYLQGQIDSTNSDIQDRTNAAFGAAGRTGSGANQYVLAKALSQNENNLRYNDYNSERGRMSQAAALAPSLDASRYSGLAAYLQAAQAAVGIPQQAAAGYAGGIGSLVGGYNTQTTSSSPSLGAILAQAAASAAKAYGG